MLQSSPRLHSSLNNQHAHHHLDPWQLCLCSSWRRSRRRRSSCRWSCWRGTPRCVGRSAICGDGDDFHLRTSIIMALNFIARQWQSSHLWKLLKETTCDQYSATSGRFRHSLSLKVWDTKLNNGSRSKLKHIRWETRENFSVTEDEVTNKLNDFTWVGEEELWNLM